VQPVPTLPGMVPHWAAVSPRVQYQFAPGWMPVASTSATRVATVGPVGVDVEVVAGATAVVDGGATVLATTAGSDEDAAAETDADGAAADGVDAAVAGEAVAPAGVEAGSGEFDPRDPATAPVQTLRLSHPRTPLLVAAARTATDAGEVRAEGAAARPRPTAAEASTTDTASTVGRIPVSTMC